MVGVMPLFGVAVVEEQVARAAEHRQAVRRVPAAAGCDERDQLQACGVLPAELGERQLLLGVVGLERVLRVFERLFDEDGVPLPVRPARGVAPPPRAPVLARGRGQRERSTTSRRSRRRACSAATRTGAGRSGCPLNYLVISALTRYARLLGDDVTIEYPAGSGTRLTLAEIAEDLCRRLISIFLVGPDGRRPCFGWVERVPERPALEGQHPVLRVLPRRQRRRPRRDPPDRLDRAGGRPDPAQPRPAGPVDRGDPPEAPARTPA